MDFILKCLHMTNYFFKKKNQHIHLNTTTLSPSKSQNLNRQNIPPPKTQTNHSQFEDVKTIKPSSTLFKPRQVLKGNVK